MSGDGAHRHRAPLLAYPAEQAGAVAAEAALLRRRGGGRVVARSPDIVQVPLCCEFVVEGGVHIRTTLERMDFFPRAGMTPGLVTFETSMNANERILAGLRAARVLACVEDRVLARLARRTKRIVHGEGDLVVAEGEPGVGFYVIVGGDAAVSVGGELVRALGPGDSFGELALASGRPRSASVVAATDLELVAIPAWDFRVFVAEYPCVARSLELQAISYA